MLELAVSYPVVMKAGGQFFRQSFFLFNGDQVGIMGDITGFIRAEIIPLTRKKDYVEIDLYKIDSSGNRKDHLRYIVSFCRNGYKGIQEMIFNPEIQEYEITNITEYAIEEMADMKTLLQTKIEVDIIKTVNSKISA